MVTNSGGRPLAYFVLVILIRLSRLIPPGQFLPVFYKVFRVGSSTDTRVLSILHGLEYWKTKRLDRANELTRLILNSNIRNLGSISPESRFNMMLAAAYDANLEILEKMLTYAQFIPSSPGARQYLEALIGYGSGASDWEDKLRACRRAFERLDKAPGPIPEYVEHASNYFHRPHWEATLRTSFRHPAAYPDLNREVETIVLVSCELSYFLIWSEHFCKSLRQQNVNVVHFALVNDADSDQAEALRHSKKLQRFAPIRLSYHPAYGANPGLLSSVYRFMIASDIMREVKCNVVIADIDSSFPSGFVVDRVVRSMSAEIGFTLNERCFVPWARMNAGLCGFRYSGNSLSFLDSLKAYLRMAMDNGASWTIDQAAIGTVWAWWSNETNVSNLHDFGQDYLIHKSLPKRLERKKFVAKSQNVPSSPILEAER